jgi:Lrp/AsnC family leucine-responsive transcriptional regulator
VDPTDARIGRLLQANARFTYEALGDAVGLSAPAVYQRVRKLEARGLITGYHARVDATRFGKGFLAFLRVVPSQSTDVHRLVERWKAASDVLACHRLAADGAFLLKLRLGHMAALEAHLDAARLEGCNVTAEPVVAELLERWTIVTA